MDEQMRLTVHCLRETNGSRLRGLKLVWTYTFESSPQQDVVDRAVRIGSATCVLRKVTQTTTVTIGMYRAFHSQSGHPGSLQQPIMIFLEALRENFSRYHRETWLRFVEATRFQRSV